jgi:hypothetical protein
MNPRRLETRRRRIELRANVKWSIPLGVPTVEQSEQCSSGEAEQDKQEWHFRFSFYRQEAARSTAASL